MRYEKQGFVTLLPPRGYFYATKQEALEAWQNGEKFKIANGPYCTIKNAEYLRKKVGSAYIKFGLNSNSVKVI